MAEIFDSVTSEELALLLASKSDAGHLHAQYVTTAQGDARYHLKTFIDTSFYTKAEIDAALTGKAASGHDHTLASLSDVGSTLPTDGQSLVWNAGFAEWRPASLVSGGVVDHAALAGLALDDHAQYHTDARGDIRYYLKATIDTNFYTKTAVDTALASKAASAHAHALSDLSNVGSVAPSDGQALVWNLGFAEWRPATVSSGGVTDHGALTGLADDDHAIYHTNARGDARYYLKSEVDAALAGKAAVVSRVFVTANHTALAEQIIAVDTDFAAVTITAPATPADQTYFFVGDAGGNAAINNITVVFGVETLGGISQDFVLDVSNYGTGFLYSGGDWELFK